jgi:hypothetical protein
MFDVPIPIPMLNMDAVERDEEVSTYIEPKGLYNEHAYYWAMCAHERERYCFKTLNEYADEEISHLHQHSCLGAKGPPLVGEEVRKRVGT